MFTLQPHPILIDYIRVWWGLGLDKEPPVAVIIWHFGWLIGRRKRIWGVIAKESKALTLGIQGSNIPRLDTPVFSSIAIWIRRVWNISLKEHFNLHLERSRSGMNAWSGSYLFFRGEKDIHLYWKDCSMTLLSTYDSKQKYNSLMNSFHQAF